MAKTRTSMQEFVHLLAQNGLGPVDAVLKIMGAVAARSMGMTRLEFARECALHGIVSAIMDARSEGRIPLPASSYEIAALKELGLDLKALEKAAKKGNEIDIEGILMRAARKSALFKAARRSA